MSSEAENGMLSYCQLAGRESLRLCSIGLGGRFGEIPNELAYELLDTYYGAGGRTVDTALVYADGASERVIGQWMRSRGNRDEITVIDKGCHPLDDGEPRVSPTHIQQDVERCLENLQCDRIDLFLLHRDDPDVPVHELLDALEVEKRSGRVLAYGASNWTLSRLVEAEESALTHGLAGFSASSCQFSYAVPTRPPWPNTVVVDRDMHAWHRDTQRPLVAWSSQSRGWFGSAGVAADPLRLLFDTPNNRELRVRAEEVASRHGATANQIALALVTAQPFPTVALVGPERPEMLSEALGSYSIKLSADEISFLERGVK